jgi:hypothetical protein
VSDEPEVVPDEEQPPQDPVPDQADPDDPIVVEPDPLVPDEPRVAPRSDEPPGDAPTPKVTGILPNNAKVGSEDFVLAVYGLNFTEDTKILFNDGEEPTEFVDATRVRTIVKPSTASGPAIVPITVVGAAESFNFAFTPEDPDDPNTYTDADSPVGGGPLV